MESLFFDYRRGFGRERHERFKESLVAFEIILLLSLLYHATVGTEDKLTRTYVRAAIPSLRQHGRESCQGQLRKDVGLITTNRAY